MNNQEEIIEVQTKKVESKLLRLRGHDVLLDRDVAELYGVETKCVNEAVRNNPDKFPDRYLLRLTKEEKKKNWSKISTGSSQ